MSEIKMSVTTKSKTKIYEAKVFKTLDVQNAQIHKDSIGLYVFGHFGFETFCPSANVSAR
jgi:hypothetical protein